MQTKFFNRTEDHELDSINGIFIYTLALFIINKRSNASIKVNCSIFYYLPNKIKKKTILNYRLYQISILISISFYISFLFNPTRHVLNVACMAFCSLPKILVLYLSNIFKAFLSNLFNLGPD